jgi:hypothetical protein
MIGAIRPRSEADSAARCHRRPRGRPSPGTAEQPGHAFPGSEGTRSWGGSALRSREPEFIAPFGSG